MKLAITGPLGHIGSRLIRTIRPHDFDEVRLIDNLATQRYCSLFGLPTGVPFRFTEADIVTADLVKLFDGCDAIVHLAAITDAATSFSRVDEVERVNEIGLRRVADAAAIVGARLLFVSSTSVYGRNEGVVTEETEPKPESPYAVSKCNGEAYLASHRGTLRSCTVRFGTIFGVSVGMRFHTAVNRFCWQARVGEPLTVWRSALHQERPYLDLDDACRAIRFVLRKDLFSGETFNVVTQNATVSGVVGLIRRHEQGLTVKLVESPILNQVPYSVSAAKIAALGFMPEGSLESGIAETLAGLGGIGKVA